MTARRAYPSDISDARWALIDPTLLAWQQQRIERRPTGESARTDLICGKCSMPCCTSIAPVCLGAIYPIISRPTAPCTSATRSGATRASSPSSTMN